MTSFADLNTFSQTSIDYDIPTQTVYLDSATATFAAPVATWELIRGIGSLVGNSVSVTYDVSSSSGASVAFNNTSLSNNTLTVTNPSTGVYKISGILDVIDYVAAQGDITPDASNTANVAYNVLYENDNVSGNISIDYLGVV